MEKLDTNFLKRVSILIEPLALRPCIIGCLGYPTFANSKMLLKFVMSDSRCRLYIRKYSSVSSV